jgi:hypothetical protein
MDKQVNREVKLQLEAVEPTELTNIEGGVMARPGPTKDTLITCTGVVIPGSLPVAPWMTTVRLP